MNVYGARKSGKGVGGDGSGVWQCYRNAYFLYRCGETRSSSSSRNIALGLNLTLFNSPVISHRVEKKGKDGEYMSIHSEMIGEIPLLYVRHSTTYIYLFLYRKLLLPHQ